MSTRVEKHIKSDKTLFDLCRKSKNLYNRANYIVRQEFINTSKEKEIGLREYANWLKYYDLYQLLKDSIEYKSLPSQTSQAILRKLEKNWKSFFKSMKEWKKNPSKFLGRPKLPKYKDKNGLKEVIYPGQNINIKNKTITIPKTNYKLKTKITKDILKELRIIPIGNKFKLEVVYEKENNIEQRQTGIKIGIDIGVNILCAITSNQKDIPTYLINGSPLKSINQYYNKILAKEKLRIKLLHNQHTSNFIKKLTLKRNFKIEDYLHKTSKKIIDMCIKHNVDEIIIGHNDNWKQNVKMRKENNQNFVQIPFNKLIQMIRYKGEEQGIKITLVEESYTSKVDHLAKESLEKQDKYLGRRIKRGLFKSSIKKLINADINGSIGILRKAIGDVFIDQSIEGLVFNPIKIKIF